MEILKKIGDMYEVKIICEKCGFEHLHYQKSINSKNFKCPKCGRKIKKADVK